VWGALSPLVDRPFLQHVVETVVGQGIREIHFILPEEDRDAHGILGDGTRWGAHFRYHAPPGKRRVYDVFKAIDVAGPDEPFLLAQSDRLPLFRLDPGTSVPTLFCWRATELRWTGWGVVRAGDMIGLPKGIKQPELFTSLVRANRDTVCEVGPRPLMAHSCEDLIEANQRVLAREFPGLLVGGKEVQPGVWIARNVSVHPTAKLTSPAFLGENSRVAAMVQVGPGACIGRDCMIERETFVSNSVVCGGSYVGQQLALKGVVVDRSRLINTRWAAEIEGVDELLLGSVYGVPVGTRFRRACGRLVAAVALVLALPCLVAMFIASKIGLIPPLTRELVVQTPAVSEPFRWTMFLLWSFGVRRTPEARDGWLRHFFFCFLPALLSVVTGHIGLTGTKPRSKEEAEQTRDSEFSACLRSRSGILQPNLLEKAGSEAAALSWLEEIKLIGRYVRLVLRDGFFGVLPFGGQRPE
jgi:lipopolysaccharide/colanic/teichoic acid biosynthesis glycosyltransferase